MIPGVSASLNETLPANPRLVLGSLIRKSQLVIPSLEKRRAELQIELDTASIAHRAIPQSPSYKNAANINDRQKMMNESITKLNKIRNERLGIELKLEKIKAEEAKFSPHLDETLPLDPSSKMVIEKRAFLSERMQHLIIRSTDNIPEEVDNLVRNLASKEFSYACIPQSSLKTIIKATENMFEKQNHLSLVGSLISLPQVRVMNPIVIHSSSVSDRIRKQAKHYYILTETVMGALFLGVGRSISGTGEKERKKEYESDRKKIEEIMSQDALVSFISQGAIPSFSNQDFDVNMWEVYQTWKETLLSDDPNTGFPIGFRYRELQEVLKENKIPFENKEDDPSSQPLSANAHSQKKLTTTTTKTTPPLNKVVQHEFLDKDLTPLNQGSLMPAPPVNGIRIGLKNIINSCWLNATLQFISCHTYYDQMLTAEVSEDKKKFQIYLREIVIRLRTNKAVPVGLIYCLADQIKIHSPKFTLSQMHQHDASEFLFSLIDILKWKPAFLSKEEQQQMNDQNLYPRQVVTYQPLSDIPRGWGKRLFHDNFKPHINITLTDNFLYNNLPVDLTLLSEVEDKCSVRLDKISADATTINESQSFDFSTKLYFTTLPDTLMVHINRTLKNQVKITNPIKLDQRRQITLRKLRIEKETVEGVMREKLVLDQVFTYKIGAAIIHRGDSGKEGHYICHERARDGTLIEHNDSSVKTGLNESQFGTFGYFLRLDRVIEPIDKTIKNTNSDDQLSQEEELEARLQSIQLELIKPEYEQVREILRDNFSQGDQKTIDFSLIELLVPRKLAASLKELIHDYDEKFSIQLPRDLMKLLIKGLTEEKLDEKKNS